MAKRPTARSRSGQRHRIYRQRHQPRRYDAFSGLQLEQLEDRRVLATFTVTNLNDLPVAASGDAPGTLRQAVFDANLNPGADEIVFNVDGAIRLTQGELMLSETLTVIGPGQTLLTIDAQFSSRIFNISTATGAFSFSDLTLINGFTNAVDGGGGAIRSNSSGDLTLSNSTIRYSSTSGGNSDGGAIFAKGDLAIIHSTIAGNSANALDSSGGGVFSEDDLTITQSTLSGNVSGNNGGGAYAEQSLTVLESTVSGNTARNGGGVYAQGTINVARSTITANTATVMGGGIGAFDEDLTIEGSIVAANMNAMTPDIFPNTGSLTVTFSLIGDNFGTTLVEAQPPTPDAMGNLIGDRTSGDGIINPMLGPLSNNGGTTQTHALMTGSPAIDLGNPAVAVDPAVFDQRGGPFIRVADGNEDGTARIDMGSYELQELDAANFIVSTTRDELDGDLSPGDVSLREAVMAANGSPGTDTITFDPTVFASAQTIQLTLGEMVMTEAVTIEGTGQNLLTVNADGISRIFNITAGSGDFSINGMTLANGMTNGLDPNGGAIRSVSSGKLNISDTTIQGSQAYGLGGGVYARNDIIITNSTITGNQASSGGGVYSNFEDVTLRQSTISNNTAFSFGGGVTAFFNLVVEQSTISGNTANIGAGLDSRGFVNITDSTVTNNAASSTGGGLYAGPSSMVEVSGSIIANNTAGFDGPDIIQLAAPNTITVTFSLIGDLTGTTLLESQTPVAPMFNFIGDSAPGTGGIIDPMLGPLAQNGGLTQTHALLSGSPAIDSGNPAVLPNPNMFDQRGAPIPASLRW